MRVCFVPADQSFVRVVKRYRHISIHICFYTVNWKYGYLYDKFMCTVHVFNISSLASEASALEMFHYQSYTRNITSGIYTQNQDQIGMYQQTNHIAKRLYSNYNIVRSKTNHTGNMDP